MLTEQETKQEKNRYETLSSERGIRKDLSTGKYQATKSIKAQRFVKNFDTLREAKHWRNTFVPGVPEDLLRPENKGITFGEVWQRYSEETLVTLSFSTRETRLEQSKFFKGLEFVPMSEMSPQVISRHIIQKKEEVIKFSNGRRFSFNNELKNLKAVFNWYKEEIDFRFVNPILKKHKALGRIKVKEPKQKKMEPQELILFLEAIKAKPFWYDFAMVQLAFAARVQEVAGLQKMSVDFKRNLLTIKDVAIWSRSTRQFVELKSKPKNGEMRTCFMSSRIREILERRMSDKTPSTFVFHLDGEPVSYRQVQHQYNFALKQCGLLGKYSATHFMRHTMATLTRYVTGSLESVQAVTGHKDQRLVQHYASLNPEIQRNALEQVEEFLSKESTCGQLRPKLIFDERAS